MHTQAHTKQSEPGTGTGTGTGEQKLSAQDLDAASVCRLPAGRPIRLAAKLYVWEKQTLICFIQLCQRVCIDNDDDDDN